MPRRSSCLLWRERRTDRNAILGAGARLANLWGALASGGTMRFAGCEASA